MNRDLDNLTPLDARNSLLLDSAQLAEYKGIHNYNDMAKAPIVSPSLHTTTTNQSYQSYNHGHYDAVPPRDTSPQGYERSQSRPRGPGRDESRDNLVSSAASMGGRDRSSSPGADRQPRLPKLNFSHGY